MITINTLTKEEIDNVPLNQIAMTNRVKICLLASNRGHIDNDEFRGKDLETLKDLKEYCLQHFDKLKRLPNFGSVSFKELQELLNHAYPDVNFVCKVPHNNIIKYTFR